MYSGVTCISHRLPSAKAAKCFLWSRNSIFKYYVIQLHGPKVKQRIKYPPLPSAGEVAQTHSLSGDVVMKTPGPYQESNNGHQPVVGYYTDWATTVRFACRHSTHKHRWLQRREPLGSMAICETQMTNSRIRKETVGIYLRTFTWMKMYFESAWLQWPVPTTRPLYATLLLLYVHRNKWQYWCRDKQRGWISTTFKPHTAFSVNHN
jgi:hypothetical protein